MYMMYMYVRMKVQAQRKFTDSQIELQKPDPDWYSSYICTKYFQTHNTGR